MEGNLNKLSARSAGKYWGGGRLNPKPAMLRGLVMGNFKLRFQPYKTLKA